jgi:hypothetical protein
MVAEPPTQQPTEPPTQPLWLPVAQAARHLGVTEQGIRRRIRENRIETKREVVGNRSRLLVRVDEPKANPTGREFTNLRERVAVLDQRVQLLEELLAEARRERNEIRIAHDRVLAILERRRWPGLWPALMRFVYGVEKP